MPLNQSINKTRQQLKDVISIDQLQKKSCINCLLGSSKSQSSTLTLKAREYVFNLTIEKYNIRAVIKWKKEKNSLTISFF